jgi:hypothetical protein
LGAVSLSWFSLYMSSLAVVFVEQRLLPFLWSCPFAVSSNSRKCLVTAFGCEAWPQCKLPVFDCRNPCWLGGKSHQCMVVADKLRLHCELVDICNSLGWGRLLGEGMPLAGGHKEQSWYYCFVHVLQVESATALFGCSASLRGWRLL